MSWACPLYDPSASTGSEPTSGRAVRRRYARPPMALDIEFVRVSGVLLNDGWHFIQPGTFKVEEFRFVTGEGDVDATPPVMGFTFTKVDQITRDVQMYNGPMTSLLAVRHDIPTTLHDDDEDDQ